MSLLSGQGEMVLTESRAHFTLLNQRMSLMQSKLGMLQVVVERLSLKFESTTPSIGIVASGAILDLDEECEEQQGEASTQRETTSEAVNEDMSSFLPQIKPENAQVVGISASGVNIDG